MSIVCIGMYLYVSVCYSYVAKKKSHRGSGTNNSFRFYSPKPDTKVSETCFRNSNTGKLKIYKSCKSNLQNVNLDLHDL